MSKHQKELKEGQIVITYECGAKQLVASAVTFIAVLSMQ